MKRRILSVFMAMVMTISLLATGRTSTLAVSANAEENLEFFNVTDEKLAQLVESGEISAGITRLKLQNGTLTNLTPLSQLTKLEFLDLTDNQISDLAPLSDLKKLRSLSLSLNLASNLTPLSKLTNLETLSLFGNQVTDLTPLGELVNLIQLDAENNQITDLTPLSNLKKLENLFLIRKPLTITQIARLQEALPKCSIFHDATDNPDNCDNCKICLSGNPPVIGHILGEDTVSIFDALEVLKALVNMDGAIRQCANAKTAALITEEAQQDKEPTIFDALEILKHLVNMPRKVEN